jgi:hypothetical protein
LKLGFESQQWRALAREAVLRGKEDLFTEPGLSSQPFKRVLALLPIRQALFEHLHITIPSTV